MVVYEADTERHFKKIVDWLATQPSGTFSLTCWGRLADVAKRQAYDIKVLEEWKKMDKTLGIFVCEDEKGTIRFVLVRRFLQKPEYDFPKPVTRVVTAFMDNQDYVNDNIDYFMELATWLIAKDHSEVGVEEVEVPLDDKYLRFVYRIFGQKNVKIVTQFNNELFGRMYLVNINLRDFL